MTDDPRWQGPSRWTHGELAGRPPAGHAVDPRNENDESRSRAEGDGASAPEPPSAPRPPPIVALAVAGLPADIVADVMEIAVFGALPLEHFVPHPDGCPRCGAYPGVPCLRLTDDHPKPGEAHVHHERRSRA